MSSNKKSPNGRAFEVFVVGGLILFSVLNPAADKTKIMSICILYNQT